MPTDRGKRGLAQVPKVPEFDRIGAAAGDHHPAVAGNRQAPDGTLVLGANLEALAGHLRVPDADGLVAASGREAPGPGSKGDGKRSEERRVGKECRSRWS